jgi:hypothetical protein
VTSPEDWDICPVCFWENDSLQRANPEMPGGANNVSLRQGQLNFQKFGACERGMLKHVRPNGFQRDPNWRPLDRQDNYSEE